MGISVRIADPDRANIVDYNSLRAFLKLNSRGTCSFSALSRDGSVRPQIGQEVRLYDDGQIVWGGSIDRVSEGSVAETNPTPRPFTLECVSWEQRLDRRMTYNTSTQAIGIYTRNYTFTANSGTDTLTTTAAHGRANADKVKVKAYAGATLPAELDAETEYYVVGAGGSTLQLSLTQGGPGIDLTTAGSGTLKLLTYRAGEAVLDIISNFMENDAIYPDDVQLGAVLDKEVFDTVPCSEAIDRLAKLSNYVWWVDADQILHFVPKALSTAPFEIDEAAAVRMVTINGDRSDKVNTALARVAWAAFGATEETFVGDGSTSAWDLADRAAKIEYIRESVGGALSEKTFGAEDAETQKDYYWNPYETRIARGDAGILSSPDSVIVGYRIAGTDIIVAENEGDIFNSVAIEGGSGRYHRYFDRTDKLGANQTLAEMQAWVAEHADIGIELRYQVDRHKQPLCQNLRPGQQQTINLIRFGTLETSWLIDEISITDAAGQYLVYDVRALSKTYIYAWLEFWKALIDRPTVSANLGSLGGVGGGGSGTDSWTRSFGVGLDLFTGTNVLDYPFIIACPSDVSNVRIDRLEFSAKVGPTGADVIADINYAGVSILAASPKLVIPAGTAADTVFQYDVSTLTTDTFANGSVFTLDFDQIGSTLPGAGFICTIVFVRA